MDPLSLVGLLLGVGAIIGGNLLEGGNLAFLLNGPAILIVLGGTLGAALLQTPPHLFWRALKRVKQVMVPPKIDLEKRIRKIAQWSALARREGLLGLEDELDREPDGFVRKGLQLLVDGNEPEVIRDAMELEMDAKEQQEVHAAKVFEAMGGYAPTLGILGAVLGLIQVMQNLTDPERLGQGIATAFVATIYGVGVANLVFLPIANKLKAHVRAVTLGRILIIEGIIAIAEGENPRNIEIKLSGFLE
ncbi:flagellar motor protein [Methylohalobius crimeensis]|uniref:flagellar motor protein n=1 Tax=Methylohalobius crimeensis TaxID=244365 RepID=UPI0003B3BF85|nr:flagellar motor protein [Methylohalobius crimeensis]